MTMVHTEVLDLADFAAVDVPTGIFHGSLKWIVVAALAFMIAIVGASALRALNAPWGEVRVPVAQSVPAAKLQEISNMNVDDRSQIMAEGLDAEEKNALIPSVGIGIGRVASFAIVQSEPTGMTALRCLTQAVYYEAATEPMQGRRAVAQVVLNRVRHPAYPKSVCGVVYQGAERGTGCQFSFTCDGSLLRAPATKAWQEAQAVAHDALSGYVETSVGAATHYHADYVLPKWAFELVKATQINRHIFYRFTGAWGQASALSARYSGVERIPVLNMAALGERLAAAEGVDASEQFTPGLTVAPSISDRHAEQDVGGRLDTTRQWRLSIPDPVAASSRYRSLIDGQDGTSVSAADKAQPLLANGTQD